MWFSSPCTKNDGYLIVFSPFSTLTSGSSTHHDVLQPSATLQVSFLWLFPHVFFLRMAPRLNPETPLAWKAPDSINSQSNQQRKWLADPEWSSGKSSCHCWKIALQNPWMWKKLFPKMQHSSSSACLDSVRNWPLWPSGKALVASLRDGIEIAPWIWLLLPVHHDCDHANGSSVFPSKLHHWLIPEKVENSRLPQQVRLDKKEHSWHAPIQSENRLVYKPTSDLSALFKWVLCFSMSGKWVREYQRFMGKWEVQAFIFLTQSWSYLSSICSVGNTHNTQRKMLGIGILADRRAGTCIRLHILSFLNLLDACLLAC